MKLLKKILYYLNPFNRLGKKQYSIVFPFFVTLLSAILLEFYVYEILKNPPVVTAPAVVIFLGLITYFAFHDGIQGGMIATWVTIFYYFYIVYTRNYPHDVFIRNLETSLALGLLYSFLAVSIGGLKQKTDALLEREANEKNRLQTIIQQMPVGVVITDKTGKITHANRQLEIILGTKLEIGSLLGKEHTLIPGNHSSPPPLSYVLTTEKPIKKREYFITKHDGKEAYIQISAAPIHNKSGQIFAAAATVTDISHQKELEKRKDDFVNIASHELKTPLTSMKLYLNSLSSRVAEYKNLQVTKILKNVSYQTDRLQELVNDLLDVSRTQTGKMIFSKEPFSLKDLLRETIESLRAIAKEKQIIFLGKKSLQVSGDKFRIQQVITNLITNAIKYSPPKTDIIVQLKAEADKAIVSVKDAGIGISKEEQKKIFNRLYQVADVKGKTFPGLGIGLYISKQIVKKHKGSIWVESEKGQGSTFFFSLPLLHKS